MIKTNEVGRWLFGCVRFGFRYDDEEEEKASGDIPTPDVVRDTYLPYSNFKKLNRKWLL